jgi:hypothetical protein
LLRRTLVTFNARFADGVNVGDGTGVLTWASLFIMKETWLGKTLLADA